MPSPERDEVLACVETLRRLAPRLCEAMMIFYDALIDEGFDHETAQYFVAQRFLKD